MVYNQNYKNSSARVDRVRQRIKNTDIPKKRQMLKKADDRRESFYNTSDYDLYQKLAGEAEARATERRQALSAAERRNRPFWRDLDVSEDELIAVRRSEMD